MVSESKTQMLLSNQLDLSALLSRITVACADHGRQHFHVAELHGVSHGVD